MTAALGATGGGIEADHPVTVGSHVASTWDWDQVNRGLAQAGHAQSFAELLAQLAPVLALTSARLIVLATATADAQTSDTFLTLYNEDETLSETTKKVLASLARSGAADGRVRILQDATESATGFLISSLPGLTDERLIALFHVDAAVPQATLTVLQAVTAHIAVWRVGGRAGRQEVASRRLAALTELLTRVQNCPSPSEASQTLADQLHDYLGCQQVVLGQCAGNSAACRVAAISQVDAFHPDNDDIRTAQAALQEAIVRGGISIWPPRCDSDRFGLKALERYARAQSCEVVVGSPLQDERGDVWGAWLFVAPAAPQSVDDVVAFVHAAQTPVASTVQLLRRAEIGPVRRWLNGLAQFLRRRRGWAVVVLSLCCVALMWAPVPHRVTCDCQLEPVTRRFVAAPFAAPLEKTFVEPGDLVTQRQLLARLDGREIRWELAGIQADLFRAAKQRAGHVASHEAGAAEIARHEVDRLQYREQLLKARDQDLEIRSPVDGMVVSGDLEDVVGKPLQVGELLFEVAPLDAMIVELAIPEDDLPEVQAGMPVRIRFDAFPLQTRETTVQRIHPRAEVVEDANVFVAEVRLENPRHLLRPGMRGHARIAAGHAPLGWVLFRRPWSAALEWLGW
jgi:hypothetical protein